MPMLKAVTPKIIHSLKSDLLFSLIKSIIGFFISVKSLIYFHHSLLRENNIMNSYLGNNEYDHNYEILH